MFIVFFDNSYFPFGPCQSLYSTQHDLNTRKDDQKFSKHFKLVASSKIKKFGTIMNVRGMTSLQPSVFTLF